MCASCGSAATMSLRTLSASSSWLSVSRALARPRWASRLSGSRSSGAAVGGDGLLGLVELVVAGAEGELDAGGAVVDRERR